MVRQRTGKSSKVIAKEFGELEDPELIHRDNLVLSETEIPEEGA